MYGFERLKSVGYMLFVSPEVWDICC